MYFTMLIDVGFVLISSSLQGAGRAGSVPAALLSLPHGWIKYHVDEKRLEGLSPSLQSEPEHNNILS